MRGAKCLRGVWTGLCEVWATARRSEERSETRWGEGGGKKAAQARARGRRGERFGKRMWERWKKGRRERWKKERERW